MTPRTYRIDQRRASAEQTRSRILRAARELILIGGLAGFTIEAVASQAGVARMTVYYQFASKRGLLEALFDDLARHSLAERLPAAYSKQNPRDALAGVIAAFCAFWDAERLVIRRIRGLAALDADFEQALAGRDERRRQGLRGIVRRLADMPPGECSRSFDDAVDALHTLTSFETFDSLATGSRTPGQVRALIQGLALTMLHLEDGRPGRGAPS
jgi:AcrR family transcriptional regulator